ncbi:MAG: glycosyltransferase [Nitrososphaera sp.]|jgi:glycosyltransferase involved in cell wall biosynthesis
MNIGVVHHSLEGRGGSGRLAVNTIETLNDMGVDVTLIISQKPDFDRIKRTYNKDIRVDKIKSIFPIGISAFGIYQRILTLLPSAVAKVDLLINTHGDLLPYHYVNKSPLITYCHFPTRALSMQEYTSKYQKSPFWKAYFAPYDRLTRFLSRPAMVKGTVLTNSRFSQNAIRRLYPDINPPVIYPCADTKSFRQALKSDKREDKVLVLCRFTPEKSVENALLIAKASGVRTTVMGSLTPSNRYYYEYLVKMSRSLGVDSLVEFKPNASFDAVIEEMSASKVYLHTMRGEHFGISIVEAMAAGLIPVVPDYGGCAEFVPQQYQYDTIERAARIIQFALSLPFSERKRISEIAELFSEDAFKANMRQVIERVLGKESNPMQSYSNCE